MDSKGDVDDEDDENNSLWMTSTQFSQLLDKQETLENMGYTLVNKKKKSKQQQQENKVRNLLVVHKCTDKERDVSWDIYNMKNQFWAVGWAGL